MVNSNGSEYMESKEFGDDCYLFLSNMCDYPGQEFHIVGTSDCESYLAHQRAGTLVKANNSKTTIFDTKKMIFDTKKIIFDTKTTIIDREMPISDREMTIIDNVTTNTPLRLSIKASQRKDSRRADATTQKATTKLTLKSKWKNLYKSTDYLRRPCPLTCPNVYEPHCVTINRQKGMYYKQFSFVNECQARIFSCMHPEEFDAPPHDSDESEENKKAEYKVSKLGWAYCADTRYIQFARMSESASSLAHYGWLDGTYRARHILTPKERRPGYG
ncbi:hypothetical protein NE865_15076 [Phthorimaea operculella]|nr:hypothetical protein NE865_15076 [Phthorimaea operculella]